MKMIKYEKKSNKFNAIVKQHISSDLLNFVFHFGLYHLKKKKHKAKYNNVSKLVSQVIGSHPVCNYW